MTSGDFAPASRLSAASIDSGPGAAGTASTRGGSATAAVAVSMSSGNASTTGPGRPDIASR